MSASNGRCELDGAERYDSRRHPPQEGAIVARKRPSALNVVLSTPGTRWDHEPNGVLTRARTHALRPSEPLTLGQFKTHEISFL
ncbi:MAG: hypothetical protein QOJ63_1315 [Solirubrobacteraceae bacterium]|nr:hypothetical protein [Solirubrobacteraceae bacterium]